MVKQYAFYRHLLLNAVIIYRLDEQGCIGPVFYTHSDITRVSQEEWFQRTDIAMTITSRQESPNPRQS